MASRRRKAAPSRQQQILDALLRIEALLSKPQTIEDRVADVYRRLLRYQYRWQFIPAGGGNVAHHVLQSAGGVEVAMVRHGAKTPDWRVGSAAWTEAPTVNHAIIAASEVALAELDGR